MAIPIAYASVIIIWSTTPLAVQWSNDSVSPIAAVLLRMGLAWFFVLLLTAVMRVKNLDLRGNWKLYAAGSLGLFPNMVLVNTAAEYIPSGLIALIFGTSPFLVALFAHFMLGEKYLTLRHFLALFIAVTGLLLIFEQHIVLEAGTDAMQGSGIITGVVLMVASVVLFAFSSVLIKRHIGDVHPVNQINGSLIFALPGLLVSWAIMDGTTPVLSQKTAGAVLYLSLVGSVIGFVAYFYLLRNLSAAAVSVITLITPVLAVWLGVVLNAEPMTAQIVSGTALVTFGLWLFSGLYQLPGRFFNGRVMEVKTEKLIKEVCDE